MKYGTARLSQWIDSSYASFTVNPGIGFKVGHLTGSGPIARKSRDLVKMSR